MNISWPGLNCCQSNIIEPCIPFILYTTVIRSLWLSHAKRSMIAWVFVIPKEGWWLRLPFFWYHTDFLIFVLFFNFFGFSFLFFWNYFPSKSRRHPSFGMTVTQAIRDLFARCCPLRLHYELSILHWSK